MKSKVVFINPCYIIGIGFYNLIMKISKFPSASSIRIMTFVMKANSFTVKTIKFLPDVDRRIVLTKRTKHSHLQAPRERERQAKAANIGLISDFFVQDTSFSAFKETVITFGRLHFCTDQIPMLFVSLRAHPVGLLTAWQFRCIEKPVDSTEFCSACHHSIADAQLASDILQSKGFRFFSVSAMVVEIGNNSR